MDAKWILCGYCGVCMDIPWIWNGYVMEFCGYCGGMYGYSMDMEWIRSGYVMDICIFHVKNYGRLRSP